MAKHWFTSDPTMLGCHRPRNIMNSVHHLPPTDTTDCLTLGHRPSSSQTGHIRQDTRAPSHRNGRRYCISIHLQPGLASFPTLGRRRLIRLWNKTRHTWRSRPPCVCRIPVCPTTRYAETRARQWSRLGMARYNATLAGGDLVQLEQLCGAFYAFFRQSSEDSATEASSRDQDSHLNLEVRMDLSARKTAAEQQIHGRIPTEI